MHGVVLPARPPPAVPQRIGPGGRGRLSRAERGRAPGGGALVPWDPVRRVHADRGGSPPPRVQRTVRRPRGDQRPSPVRGGELLRPPPRRGDGPRRPEPREVSSAFDRREVPRAAGLRKPPAAGGPA